MFGGICFDGDFRQSNAITTIEYSWRRIGHTNMETRMQELMSSYYDLSDKEETLNQSKNIDAPGFMVEEYVKVILPFLWTVVCRYACNSRY